MNASELLVKHAPHAPATLRARVYELAPPRRTRVWRIGLVVAPVALAGIAAAIVVGVRSGGTTPEAQHRTALQPTVTTVAFGAATAAPSDKAFVPSVAGARLQRTDVTLSVRVGDAQSATSKATRIATSLGGYAQSVEYDSARKQSQLVLRVPADRAKDATARLAALGTLVSQQLSVEDLQQELKAETARIAQLERTVVALQKAVADPSLPDAQKVLLRIRLAEARRSLALTRRARGGTISAGSLARISLTLTTKRSPGAALPHPRGHIGRMIHSALGFLALEATAVLYVLIAVGPFALLGAAGLLLARARRSRMI